MVILSTIGRNRAFPNMIAAELWALDNEKQNCCVLSDSGKVLSFKRKDSDRFTRITKQYIECDTPLSQAIV